jgi:hypothetical protein
VVREEQAVGIDRRLHRLQPAAFAPQNARAKSRWK